MELSLPAGSCDVAFSNWLLMYLGDAEVQQLARNMLSWVRAAVVLGMFVPVLMAFVTALAVLCGCASERCGGAAAGTQHALLGVCCLLCCYAVMAVLPWLVVCCCLHAAPKCSGVLVRGCLD